MTGDFVHISLGSEENIGLYQEVFHDSALYSRYYEDNDILLCTLEKAVANRELWIGTHGEGGEIVAVMQVMLRGFFGGFPYLALLGVKKGWRGMGVGHFMIASFEEAARQLGYAKTSILTSSFNQRARRLYQSLGYKKIGFLQDAFRKGIDEIIFVKTL
jgi:ribosomal protein S18 acetylase RimI-like enzyme